MDTKTMTILFSQLKENPLNWALLAVLAYVVKSYAHSSKPAVIEAEHPKVFLFRNYSPLDLLQYDGTSKENGGRILMGVNGSVYDVTKGRNFYGPEGPYANFGGHDASRGLAKHSFDSDMVCDPNDRLINWKTSMLKNGKALRDWEQHFNTKYLLVGKLVENE